MIAKYIRFIRCIFLFLFVSIASIAQETDSIKTLKPVDVISNRDEKSKSYRIVDTKTIHFISIDNLRTNSSFHVSDALCSLPGVNQLNTGVSISKPVIRGLYGSRLQTLLFGLRFDNQQWQDEHGLGISDFGLDKVDVIRGPSALLYGSEAIGGVLRIVEEKNAEEGKIMGDIRTRFMSNTLGNSTNIGFKGNSGKRNWGVRAGYESHADYTDGKNTRILNSRFGGYYFKATYGFQKNKWSSQNNYSSSVNNFGFIMSNNPAGKTVDNRFSRTMDGPHHTVFLNILSSQNSIQLKSSVLKINIGGQSNIRMEDEGGGEISLNMHLSSFVYNLQWIKSLSDRTEFILSNQGLAQSNVNYGKRVIVPDARTVETGLSAFLNHRLRIFLIEAGLGGNYRYLKTLPTANFSSPDKEIQAFEKPSPALNAMLCLTATINKNIELKLNGSTGFRSGNMAELSSNGLHEGTFQYEIGNPNLRTEQNYNVDLTLNYTSTQVSLYASVFNNYFGNYIYLAPTSESFYGIPIYRYYQSPADLYGGEIMFTYNPIFLKKLQFSSNFATVTGVLNDTAYLPYIPANKLHTEFSYSFRELMHFKSTRLTLSNDCVFKQDHPATNETATNSYFLFNAAIGSAILVHDHTILISIGCNNILNHYYYDHLSRLKIFGYHNIGRNFVLTLQLPFNLKK